MLEFRFELFLGGSWVDVTPYVRQKNAVTIKRGKGDESVKLQPSSAKFVLENADDRFNPRNPLSPYYGLLVRNTPVRISAVVGAVNNRRFYGEVYSFEPRWNEDRSDCFVVIEAAGVLRRVLQNQTESRSAYRQWVNNHTGNPVPKYYWPLEDGSDAVEGLPEIGSGAAVFSSTPLKKSWGAGDMNDWFPNGVKVEDLNTLTLPCDMRGSSASAWEMTALMNFPNDDTTLLYEINCSTQTWYIYVSSVTDTVMTVDPTGAADISPFTVGGPLKDVGPIWMTFRVSYVSGTLSAYISWDRVSDASNSVNVNVAAALSLPLQFPRYAKVSNGSNAVISGISGDVTINLSNLSFSECSTGTTDMGTAYAQMKGQPNELASDRFLRLCEDQGVSADASNGGSTMGRQFVQGFDDHLTEIAASSGSLVYESRSTDDLVMVGGILLSANYIPSLSLAYDELIGSIEPVEDDQQTVNEVSVVNKASGSALVRKDTGEMSIQQIGRFSDKLEVNNYRFSEALAWGQFKVARGTQVVPRIPSVTVSAAATPSEYAAYLDADISWFLLLNDLDPAGYFDRLHLRITGIEETITATDHRITFNVVPDEMMFYYFVVEAAGILHSLIDASDCTTSALVNSTATTIDVETPTSRWTTTSGDWPFDISIAGERLTVTAVSNVDSNTQRFTVTRSVNGVVKSLPAGSKVELFRAGHLGVL